MAAGSSRQRITGCPTVWFQSPSFFSAAAACCHSARSAASSSSVALMLAAAASSSWEQSNSLPSVCSRLCSACMASRSLKVCKPFDRGREMIEYVKYLHYCGQAGACAGSKNPPSCPPFPVQLPPFIHLFDVRKGGLHAGGPGEEGALGVDAAHVLRHGGAEPLHVGLDPLALGLLGGLDGGAHLQGRATGSREAAATHLSHRQAAHAEPYGMHACG